LCYNWLEIQQLFFELNTSLKLISIIRGIISDTCIQDGHPFKKCVGPNILKQNNFLSSKNKKKMLEK